VPLLDDDGTTLVLSGDVPLIETGTLRRLVGAAAPDRLALLTIELADPHGYGRVVRKSTGGAKNAIAAIVEEKDASADVRAIREIYTGVMARRPRR
jgi:N-acetylglucosamine-1-phosphate uridyltransferase (contains nucleotidyltransferase and I-patch acetyltransferase domains)